MSEFISTLEAIEGPVGVLIGVLGAKVFQREKAKRELELSVCEEARTEADAASILTSTAMSLLAPLQDHVDRLDKRIAALERENRETQTVLRVAVSYIRALRTWINVNVPTLSPPDLPDAIRPYHDREAS